jgi:hypothetical protein
LNAVTTGAMQVIKIWLLISMVSLPGMPSVKHTAELYFNQDICENRRVVIENSIYDRAAETGINPVYVETWCLESNMFVENSS